MITNAIGTVIAATLLRELRKNLVYKSLTNESYKGEVSKKGDSVDIINLNPPTVKNYVRGNALEIEFPADGKRTLIIDQEKYFNVAFDDIDILQSSVKGLRDYARNQGVYGFMDAADSFIAGAYVDVDAGNIIAPTVVTKDNIYDLLVELGEKLTTAKVPKDGRVAILPPWMCSLLQKNDYFVHATEKGDDVLTNGVIGKVAGFKIGESHNVPNTAGNAYKVLAGHPMAITFADQINKVVPYEHPDYFGEFLKGLYNYGKKVVQPTALALLTANKS